MCGIAGAAAARPGARPDPEVTRRMARLIAHRGPDGEGHFDAPGARSTLAHRRLSIIDLATGAQPMTSPDGRYALVFNGEIYNYVELRQQLERRGETFRTTSDTEVLLRLFEREGADCLRALRGMYAFAIWDAAEGRLTVAKDRLGKKPLYYTVAEDGCLYFASTLKALRETLPGAWAIDPAAVDAYLTLGYIPAPATVYEGVYKLPAASVLTADADGVRVRSYWDLAEEDAPFEGTYEQAADRLDELLNEAVRIRLRSDVPLGVFLSGGIDSSLVAAVAARQSPTQVNTFSIGMDVAAFDESGYAAEVATRLGTAHHLFRAKPDLLALLPDMVWHYGEPYADSSALPSWLLAQQARRHVTVALGGDGGDEAFAGYNWYRTAAKLHRVNRAIPEPAFAVASYAVEGLLGNAFAGSPRVGQVRRGIAALAMQRGGARFAALRSFVGVADARALYAGELRAARGEGLGPTGALIERLYRACQGSDLRCMRVVDIKTYLADCLLPKVDVATMAHGLELRAPLLDQEVVRFALSLPDEWVLSGGTSKRILRDVLGRYLPLAMFDRPKQGFSIPLVTWFRTSMRAAAEALPRSERLLGTGWFAPGGIDALVREHVSGVRDHSQRLFSLLALDEWLKRR